PNADGLIYELMCVPFQCTGGKHSSAGIFENGIHHAPCEDACEQRADGAARAMNAECVERIVVTEACFHMRNHQVAEHTSDSADAESGHRRDKTCRGRDGNQTCDCTGNRAEGAGLAIAKPFSSHPSDDGRRRGKMCCYKSAGSQTTRAQRAAGIETEPSQPDQASADKTQHHAVRRHGPSWITDAVAK